MLSTAGGGDVSSDESSTKLSADREFDVGVSFIFIFSTPKEMSAMSASNV
jgi:hypothetical protein